MWSPGLGHRFYCGGPDGGVHSGVPLTWDDERAYAEASIKEPRSKPVTRGYTLNGHWRRAGCVGLFVR